MLPGCIVECVCVRACVCPTLGLPQRLCCHLFACACVCVYVCCRVCICVCIRTWLQPAAAAPAFADGDWAAFAVICAVAETVRTADFVVTVPVGWVAAPPWVDLGHAGTNGGGVDWGDEGYWIV